MAYRTTRLLELVDAAWIAGLIDGEGSIGLLRRHKGEHRQLVISIANTERNLLDFVLERTGVGKITRKRALSRRHTPSYAYTVSNTQALTLLAQLRPFLRSCKALRADLILADYARLTPRNGKYTAELIAARESFIERCMAIRSGEFRGPR